MQVVQHRRQRIGVAALAQFDLLRRFNSGDEFFYGQVVGVAYVRECRFDEIAVFCVERIIFVYSPYAFGRAAGFGAVGAAGGFAVASSSGTYSGLPSYVPTCFMLGTFGAASR